MARKCSNCTSTMVVENAHGVMLDVCPECGGIWLNSDQLHALLTGDARTLEEIEHTVRPHGHEEHMGKSKLLCPECEVLLDEYHYLYNSPIIIHTCSDCGGIFVNADQLPQMKQWLQLSHEPPTQSEKQRIALGMDVAEHDAFMMRQERLQGLFRFLRRTRSGFSGLLP